MIRLLLALVEVSGAVIGRRTVAPPCERRFHITTGERQTVRVDACPQPRRELEIHLFDGRDVWAPTNEHTYDAVQPGVHVTFWLEEP